MVAWPLTVIADSIFPPHYILQKVIPRGALRVKPANAVAAFVQPGAVRSDDGAIPALGGQPVMVDVRIPAAASHIDRSAKLVTGGTPGFARKEN
jgi:hypothetical protein